jgi:hypothetical protein
VRSFEQPTALDFTGRRYDSDRVTRVPSKLDREGAMGSHRRGHARFAEVKIMYEPSRVEQQCLSSAYERVVPVSRRAVGITTQSVPPITAVMITAQGRVRGGRK